MKKVIAWIVLFLVASGLFTVTALSGGLMVALFIWGLAVTLTALIVWAISVVAE